jgi:flagellin-specific chaperone FliS
MFLHLAEYLINSKDVVKNIIEENKLHVQLESWNHFQKCSVVHAINLFQGNLSRIIGHDKGGVTTETMAERYTYGISGRVASTNKLNVLQLDPGHVTSTPVTSAFDKLTQEGDDSLSAIFVLSGEVDFVAEDNQPPSDLHWGKNNTIWSLVVLEILLEGLQDELWRGPVVALEKLRPTTSMSGGLRNALKRVVVFPEPGGPQSIRGLCSDNQEYNTSSW